MKALFYKQFKLVCHPMTLLFPFSGVMLLIPSYPYTVAFFYVTLGVFFMMQNGREQRDMDFSALLPIRKRDTVKVTILFTVFVELFSLLFAVPFAVISAKHNSLGTNAAGIDANIALFGMAFLLFAVFNFVFFTAFYRTGYKVGTAFLKASVGMFFVVAGDVILPHVPGLTWLDGGYSTQQMAFLLCGAVVFAAAAVCTYRISAQRYEKVDG